MLFLIEQAIQRWINYSTAIIELLLMRKTVSIENIELITIEKYVTAPNLITFWIDDDFYNDEITNPIIDAICRWMLSKSLNKAEALQVEKLISWYSTSSSSDRVKIVHEEVVPHNVPGHDNSRRQLKEKMYKLNKI